MQYQDTGYLLHIQPYKETSALVRLFTAHHGMVGAIIKGVYRKDKKAAGLRASLQLGNALELLWIGRSDLKTLTQVEVIQRFPAMDNKHFLCLCYANELLIRFLHEGESAADIFVPYQQLLLSLGRALESCLETRVDSAAKLESFLRHFEFELLDALGYGMDFSLDVFSETQVFPKESYRVTAGVGVQRQAQWDEFAFSGEDLLSIQRREFEHAGILHAAKRISRYLLNHYLDGKPLKTRQLYRDMYS